MNYRRILQQAIDLHVHVGPEIIPRKFTLSELLKYESGKLRGVGIKNHFFPTVAMEEIPVGDDKPIVVHSVVLNHYVGGFNPDIILASAELSERPIIVWFPTLHSKKFLKSQKFEIPEEWIDQNLKEKFRLRSTTGIKALSVLDSRGTIIQEVKDILRIIKECDAILATGHLSWEESRALVNFAVGKIGIKKVIITHPIYQRINMPINIQKAMAKRGALIEHCYSMYSIDNIAIEKIVRQIKEVGAKNCILSSDVGQTFSKSPSESLTNFITLLEKEGVTEKEIKTMLVDNPNKLVG